MLKETKAYPSTLHTLEDTIRAVKDPDLSKRYDEQISLVGVSLETLATINPDILAEPIVKTSRRGVDDRLELTVTLKPETDEQDRLLSLHTLLSATQSGYVHGLIEEEEKPPTLARYLENNSALSSIQDYDTTLHFFPGSSDVVYRDFKIDGNMYRQFTVTGSPELEGETYEIRLHLLFKEHDGIESFFSVYTKETLTKATTIKLLGTISDRNITGLFIGGVYYSDKNIRLNTQALSTIEGKHVVDDGDAYFDFYTADTYISIGEDRIKESTITPLQANKYAFKVYLKGGGSITLYLG